MVITFLYPLIGYVYVPKLLLRKQFRNTLQKMKIMSKIQTNMIAFVMRKLLATSRIIGGAIGLKIF